jgi:hypothetical protein
LANKEIRMKRIASLYLFGIALAVVLAFGIPGNANAFVNDTNSRLILVDGLEISIGDGGVGIDIDKDKTDQDRDRTYNRDRPDNRDRNYDRDREHDQDRDDYRD